MIYTFDTMVGNHDIKIEASTEIEATRRRQDKIANILITGPSGTGKTHLALAMAHASALKIYNMNSPLVDSLFDDVLDIMDVAVTGNVLNFTESIVFFDESHELSKPIQQTLLKVLLERNIDVNGLWYNLDKVCWIFGTTNPEKMIAPLRQRCGLNWRLVHYTIMELAQIFSRMYLRDSGKVLEISIEPDLAHCIARRSRFTPRIGNSYLERVYNMARATVDTPEEARELMTVELAEEFFRRRKINEQGLGISDFAYLRCLENSRKALGVKGIAGQIDLTDKEVTENIEPFLRHLGLIDFTKTGRVLTPKGRILMREVDSMDYTREQINDTILA